MFSNMTATRIARQDQPLHHSKTHEATETHKEGSGPVVFRQNNVCRVESPRGIWDSFFLLSYEVIAGPYGIKRSSYYSSFISNPIDPLADCGVVICAT